MVRAGDELVNPVTWLRTVFRKTAVVNPGVRTTTLIDRIAAIPCARGAETSRTS